MLIKMGQANEEVLEKGITLYQALHVTRTAPPTLLAQLSTSEAPVRVWHAYEKTQLAFAPTDIRAFAKFNHGIYLGPEEAAGARNWLDYVAQTTELVPSFAEVYADEPGHADCTFDYADAVFWASMGSDKTFETMLRGTILSEEDQKGFLAQVKALQEVAPQFHLSDMLSPFDAPCISLLEVAETRAAVTQILRTAPDYLTSQVAELGKECPLLTAFIKGDVATLRSFVARRQGEGHLGESGLAMQILEEELPSIPRYRVAKLFDGEYGFSNPLWIYIKAVESFSELVRRFT